MEEKPSQTSRAELESSGDLTANAGEARIEQLCEAVRGLSPELKLAWYDFKTATHHEGS
jgi:hypothetical protein